MWIQKNVKIVSNVFLKKNHHQIENLLVKCIETFLISIFLINFLKMM